jgi:hypothetical protein
VGNSPSVAAADVNGDGKVDLITANYSDNTVTVLTNNGDGTFTFCSSNAVGNVPYYLTTADVNADGKADIITANQADSTLTVLTNNGDGTFAFCSSNAVGTGPVFVTAADVNGDGVPDLISANFGSAADGHTLTVLLNLTPLKIQTANGGGVLVSWFPAWPGYQLQQNSNLGTTNWNNVSNPSGTNRVTISPATGNNFFRLRHQ